ncbi:Transcriptional regulator of ribosomal biogenesis proteins, partial [Kickxella alabastrina]
MSTASFGSSPNQHSNSSQHATHHYGNEPMAVVDEDFYYPRDLEASFCRDFSCCGLILNDLHDLLQHYEECHVRFEDDEAQPDLGDNCFFDEEWSPTDCLTTGVGSDATDLSSYGLTLEQQLILSATTTNNSASSTAVPSPTLPSKSPGDHAAGSKTMRGVTASAAHSTTQSARNTPPPLSPSQSVMSSVTGSPQEAVMPFSLDMSLLASRKRSAMSFSSGDHAPLKKQTTMTNAEHAAAAVAAATAVAANSPELAFPSSVLGLYDDDIIAAIASATDPLFLSTAAAAAAAAGNGSGMYGRRRSDSESSCDSLTKAANAAVMAVSGDNFDDDIHLPPSVTAAMAGAVAAAAAAKAHGLLPRDDKPYRCPVSSCDKAYKNPNGLKYHNLHGHCNMGEEARGISKPYKCRVPECYKAYKNLNGLKYHVQHAHCAMIPSIRDLPPNATPAEVAAAVAAAAAAAAASAAFVGSSVPSSPVMGSASPAPATPISSTAASAPTPAPVAANANANAAAPTH